MLFNPNRKGCVLEFYINGQSFLELKRIDNNAIGNNTIKHDSSDVDSYAGWNHTIVWLFLRTKYIYNRIYLQNFLMRQFLLDIFQPHISDLFPSLAT